MKNVFKSLLFSLLFFVIYFIFQVLVMQIFTIVISISSAHKNPYISLEEIYAMVIGNLSLILFISMILSIAVYIIIAKLRHKSLLKTMDFKTLSLKHICYLLIFTIFTALFTNVFVNVIAPYFPSYNEVSDTLGQSVTTALGLLVTVVFAPIFEEILFRGLIFKELSGSMNVKIAIVLQAVIFGAAHMNMLQFIYAFTLGLFLGLIYYWSRSLIAPIIVHCLYNFLGSVIFPNYLPISKMLAIIYLISGLIFSLLSIHKLYKLRDVNIMSANREKEDVENSQ